MTLFLNRFRDGCFLDTAPQADADVLIVELSEEDARTLAALLALESYPVARALAALHLAGISAPAGTSKPGSRRRGATPRCSP